MEYTAELLANAIAEALSGRQCVSAWLGYGNALFLGFGSETIAPRNSQGRRTKPPYELQTSMAGWRVSGDEAASSEDERNLAERSVAGLIGRPVASWRLTTRFDLEVEFAGGGTLEVVPPSEVDPEWSDLDNWWFCLPGDCFIGVGSGGRVVAGRTDRPKSSKDAE
ncbi:MAG TPA: hypothetical protein DDY78_28085 [Planctomycetales bacterium]|jgi:hypothetical protein|nr:hypothetical protein [Planctomycetales bacterium]